MMFPEGLGNFLELACTLVGLNDLPCDIDEDFCAKKPKISPSPFPKSHMKWQKVCVQLRATSCNATLGVPACNFHPPPAYGVGFHPKDN